MHVQCAFDDEIEHKFNEPALLEEIRQYIDSTYDQHYARNKLQTFESIVDCGHGEGFTIGNILKYASRYGAKEGFNRDDIMKVIHYGILALYVHDLREQEGIDITIDDLYEQLDIDLEDVSVGGY